jgi:cell wall-associated NlpC family hydrolase
MTIYRYFGYLLLLLGLLTFSQCHALRPVPDSRHSSGGNAAALRQDIVRFARQHVGTSYRYGGRDPRQGFDCSGFTHYVLREYNIQVTPQSGAQANEGRPLSVRTVQPGDLIYFKRSSLGSVFHVALVVSNDANGLVVVHSTTSRGVITTNLTESSYWAPKIAGARDVIGR